MTITLTLTPREVAVIEADLAALVARGEVPTTIDQWAQQTLAADLERRQDAQTRRVISDLATKFLQADPATRASIRATLGVVVSDTAAAERLGDRVP